MFPDKFSFFMFCLGCCLAFSQSIGKFQTSVAHERLERVKSNADQSNFLAKKSREACFRIMCKNIINNNSPKTVY